MSNVNVTLPDGTERELPVGSTAGDLAAEIGPGLAKAALIAVVDGDEVDLDVPLPDGATVQLVTGRDELGLETIRHSTAHLMAQAILDLHPGARFAIGPPIEHGFYYDFDLPDGKTLSDDDLGAIEARMKELVKADQPFERHEISIEEAVELFKDEPYKLEIIENVQSGAAAAEDAGEVSGDVVSYYRNSDTFLDMCTGPHVPSTGQLEHFKLQKVAGAYWRGDPANPQAYDGQPYGTVTNNARPTVGVGSLQALPLIVASTDLKGSVPGLHLGVGVMVPNAYPTRDIGTDYELEDPNTPPPVSS